MLRSLLRPWPNGPGWNCGPYGHALETAHVTLRRPKRKDAESIRSVFDEDAIYWLGLPKKDSEVEAIAKQAQARFQRRPYSERWVICDRSSSQVIGIRNLTADREDPSTCVIQNALTKEWRGRGLAAEELACVIGVMPHLGFRRVQAFTLLEHEVAIKLYTKFGFVRQKVVERELPNGYIAKQWLMTFDVTTMKKMCDLRRDND